MHVFDISWSETLTHLVLAYLLAVPIAWNRERESRGAGLRTFPLVAMKSCGFMTTGLYVLDSTDAQARARHLRHPESVAGRSRRTLRGGVVWRFES